MDEETATKVVRDAENFIARLIRYLEETGFVTPVK